jgi:hypothetical protein
MECLIIVDHKFSIGGDAPQPQKTRRDTVTPASLGNMTFRKIVAAPPLCTTNLQPLSISHFCCKFHESYCMREIAMCDTCLKRVEISRVHFHA